MENSTGQEKKGFNLHGRKKKIIIACIAVFLLFSFIGRGLGMRGGMGFNSRGHLSRDFKGSLFMGAGNSGITTAKDFETIEVVFAESTATRRNGYGVTYDALMREAASKGADIIINVNIAPTSGIFNVTWSGSALAIRYAD